MKLGHRMTDKQRAKLSAALMGHVVSQETRAKLSVSPLIYWFMVKVLKYKGV